jgi:hypothetical protein
MALKSLQGKYRSAGKGALPAAPQAVCGLVWVFMAFPLNALQRRREGGRRRCPARADRPRSSERVRP